MFSSAKKQQVDAKEEEEEAIASNFSEPFCSLVFLSGGPRKRRGCMGVACPQEKERSWFCCSSLSPAT